MTQEEAQKKLQENLVEIDRLISECEELSEVAQTVVHLRVDRVYNDYIPTSLNGRVEEIEQRISALQDMEETYEIQVEVEKLEQELEGLRENMPYNEYDSAPGWQSSMC